MDDTSDSDEDFDEDPRNTSLNRTILTMHTLYSLQSAALVGIGFTVHYAAPGASVIPEEISPESALLYCMAVLILSALILTATRCTCCRCASVRGRQRVDTYQAVSSQSDQHMSHNGVQVITVVSRRPQQHDGGSAGHVDGNDLDDTEGGSGQYAVPRQPLCQQFMIHMPFSELVLKLLWWMIILAQLIAVLVSIDDNWFVIPVLCSIAIAQLLFLPLFVAARAVKNCVVRHSRHQLRNQRPSAFKPEMEATSSIVLFMWVFLFVVCLLFAVGTALVVSGVVDTSHIVAACVAFVCWILMLHVDNKLVIKRFKAALDGSLSRSDTQVVFDSKDKPVIFSPIFMSPFILMSLFLRLITSEM